MKPLHLLSAPRARQSGFTIVEMMVALTISLVVVLGISVTFVNIKQTFLSQDKVAQLQDNERLAMTVLTAQAQEAGYFPMLPNAATAVNTQIATSSYSTYGTMAAGQAVMGVAAAGSTPESLSLAFATSNNDGLITCLGHTIATADIAAAGAASSGVVTVRNIFYVDPTAKTLNCQVLVNGSTSTSYGASGATPQPLVTNVTSMSVAYGIVGASGSVVGYMPPSPSIDWTTVRSLRITLNFVDPNNSASTIPWVQTINLLNP